MTSPGVLIRKKAARGKLARATARASVYELANNSSATLSGKLDFLFRDRLGVKAIDLAVTWAISCDSTAGNFAGVIGKVASKQRVT